MRPRTRSAASSPAKRTATTSTPVTEQTSDVALRVLISPCAVSNNSRLLLLKHPRDGMPTRFLFCRKAGLLELKKFSTSSLDPRSTILTYDSLDDEAVLAQQENDGTEQECMSTLAIGNQSTRTTPPQSKTGHIIREAEVTIASPFDIVFLLLRILAEAAHANKRAMFQPLDDVLNIPESDDKHFSYVLNHGRYFIEQAMEEICDTVFAGDEKMFRYSEEKVMHVIINKARLVVARGLPASLDERYVLRPLESPILSVSRTDEEAAVLSSETRTETSTSLNSQSTNTSSVSTIFSIASDAITVASTPERDVRVDTSFLHLLRLRTAISFISSCYLPPALAQRLQVRLTTKDSPLDFGTLDAHLQHLRTLRADALASRSMTDFSQKRGHADDDEAAEARAEKKRKLEEEERKQKANISRGVRDLKKVNISGMKKMSDFFSKKPVGAKAKS